MVSPWCQHGSTCTCLGPPRATSDEIAAAFLAQAPTTADAAEALSKLLSNADAAVIELVATDAAFPAVFLKQTAASAAQALAAILLAADSAVIDGLLNTHDIQVQFL